MGKAKAKNHMGRARNHIPIKAPLVSKKKTKLGEAKKTVQPAARPLMKVSKDRDTKNSAASSAAPVTQLPVTVLSGFLGAGKTTLLKHILRTAGSESNPMRIAVVVNDMGEINLDASEIKLSKLIREDATMVEMTNGCICCTLRGDLLKTVKALSEEKAFDYLIIESTGISEPLQVAQTFVMDVDGDTQKDDDRDDTQTTAIFSSDAKNGGNKSAKRRKKINNQAAEKRSLSHFARLDTLVTVVDALNIFDVLSSLETLAEENLTNMVGNSGIAEKGEAEDGSSDGGEDTTDDRSIAQLWLDQIEFANVIVLSKVHLLGTQTQNKKSASLSNQEETGGRKRKKQIISRSTGEPSSISEKSNEAAVLELTSLIKRLNPKARVIVPKQSKFADVKVGDLVCTGLFDMEEAQLSAGWKLELQKEAEGVGHTPETEEYGVGSVVFRSRERPFHAGRLQAILQGFGNYKSCAELSAAGAGPAQDKDKGRDNDGVFDGLVRAKGTLWIASAHAYPVDFHAAGRYVELNPYEMPYLAAVPTEEWNEEDEERYNDLVCSGEWHDINGDRSSVAVFIGVHLDKGRMNKALEDALLTDAELAGGVEVWKQWEDPFFGGEYLELAADNQGEEEEEEEEEDEEEKDEEAKQPPTKAAVEKEVRKKRKAETAAKPSAKASNQESGKRARATSKEGRKKTKRS